MFDEFLKEFQDGISGKHRSIFLPAAPLSGEMSRLGKRININAGTYILLGGASGTGKSSYVDSQFIIYPYLQGENIEYIYRSMERPVSHKIAKWICLLLYIKEGLVIDVPTVFQWYNRKFDMTKDVAKKILDSEETIEDLLKKVTIIPGSASPQEVFNFTKEFMMKKGKLITTDNDHLYVNGEKKYDLVLINDKMGFAHKNFVIYQNSAKYIPDGNTIFFQINDHIGKLSGDDKTKFQVHADNMAFLTDICRMVVIDVTQFNRNSSNTTRKLKEKFDVKEEDFRGSSVPYHNASLVMGITNPYKLGYEYLDVIGKNTEHYIKDDSFENRLRVLKVVKNTHGVDDFFIPLYFMGENGGVAELPHGKDVVGPDGKVVLELNHYWK